MDRREQFSPEARSIRAARMLVSEALFSTDDAATAVVLASELCANAVDHARTPFTIEVDHDDLGALTVRVHDFSPDLPVLLPRDPRALRGRGLHLVDALAHEWGARPMGDLGKTVWFRLLPLAG
jgi:anti-sigma regulatory factor (Ser/Thr protein kinase)